MRTLVLSLLSLALAGTALASDGVREINQTCALQTGCFPGDTAGFPVTVSASGSYRLTSGLDLTSLSSPQNVTAIEVTANDVSVDLNGFGIVGSVSCGGTPPTCSASGSGIGVSFLPSNQRCAVSNGAISGMGSDGVRVGFDCLVENLRIASNAGRCIAAGQGAVIRSNNMRVCAGNAIQAGSGSLVVENTAAFCGGFGVALTDATAGFGSNVFRFNNGGFAPQTSSGTEIGGNVCNLGSACP